MVKKLKKKIRPVTNEPATTVVADSTPEVADSTPARQDDWLEAELATREAETDAQLAQLTDELVGEENEDEEEDLPSRVEEDEEDEAEPPAPRRRLEGWEAELLTSLEVLDTYTDVKVVDFMRFANISDDRYASHLLTQYVAQELVVRNWKEGAGRYSLTDAGRARLAELRAL